MHTRNIFTLWIVLSWSGHGWTQDLSEPSTSDFATSYPDIELVEFVVSAVDKNPRVLATQAALNASDALRSAASRPLYNPEIEVEATNAEVETRTLGISQTFDIGNKRAALDAVATADMEAAQADLLSARQNVTLELLLAVSAFHTASDRDALADERVAALHEFSELAKQRFDAGDLSQTEFNLASLVAAQARLGKAVTASDLADAVQQLNSLISEVNLTRVPRFDFSLPTIATLEDPLARLMSLPEIRAARLRVDSANAAIDLRQRERRPDPTISLVGGEEGDQRLVGLSLSIPLPVRNTRAAEVTAASELHLQAWQEADNILLQSRARFFSAYERYQLAHSAWNDWQQFGQLSLQNQADQLEQLWQAGELSTSDFLVQMSQVIDSEDSALALRQTLWNAWFEWLAASNQIDQWIAFDRDPNQI
jgi:outer membrane protein, heavy metal efflux system